MQRHQDALVELGVLGISEVVNHRRVGTSTAAVLREGGLKVDRPVEAQAAVVEDIDPVRRVVTGGVEEGYLPSCQYAAGTH